MILSFICCSLIAALAASYALLTPTLLKKLQPPLKKKLIELVCDGWLARKILGYGWAAQTTPFPFFVVIMYFCPKGGSPAREVRVHEAQHCYQDERNPFFLVTWFNYYRETIKEYIKVHSWMAAYYTNVYEIEAYKVEDDATAGNWPSWA